MRADTLSIQCESDLRNTLDLLYQSSSINKSFTGLLELITNREVIVSAIHNIKSNKGSKTLGLDNKTINDFLLMDYDETISLIQQNILNYNPFPVRRVYIPKSNSDKMRPLGIPAMIDRIIQECFRIILEPILEAKFFKHSYAFRPYRETGHALGRLQHLIKSKVFHVIEGDIKGYFDNINHRLLLKKLWEMGVTDKRVISIIKAMLKAGIMENSIITDSNLGTPQGGILSPLLANAYLHSFDKTLESSYENPYNLKQFTKKFNAMRNLRQIGFRPMYLVRYADDWVVLTDSEQLAHRKLRWLRKYFKHKLCLELSEEKTVITDIRKKSMKFLGFCIKAEPALPIKGKVYDPNHLVAKIFPNPEKVKNQTHALCKEIREIPEIKGIDFKMAHIEKINAKIIGIAEYWSKGLCKQTFGRIDNVLHQRCYFTWKRMFKKSFRSFLIPVKEFTNRPNRHSNYLMESWAIISSRNSMKIGITKMKITPSNWCRPFDPEMIPYTDKGRTLYASKRGKNNPLIRPPLYGTDLTDRIKFNEGRKYNFEYYMNREYSFNRDKGCCRICGDSLWYKTSNCHHINPHLDFVEVNKVNNLAWMCEDCHINYIHGKEIPEESKIKKKVTYFRKHLVKESK
ncbi:group II intron reverse transcriptase/maturase [Paenibacillus periandrae]|uniref:group II intron reverse transcriptase/maturase n=1 Tax=Paenibacillus periandrae TaxID=1761741 RepID=UPI001F090521|nr:group II intron reverse transcriptase/maturase [Paenibacillus periandrae]